MVAVALWLSIAVVVVVVVGSVQGTHTRTCASSHAVALSTSIIPTP